MSDTELMSGCIIRHRVVREEALHTAANGDGDEHGADYADSDESFVEEKVREVAISDIYNQHWRKSVILTIGVAFTMDMQLKIVQFMEKEKMNLELFHQDPYNVVQKGMKSHNPNLCLYL